MTRTEHLAWCKQRALAYLPSEPSTAVKSMVSDLRKHPETSPDNNPVLREFCMSMLLKAWTDTITENEAREFINSFS